MRFLMQNIFLIKKKMFFYKEKKEIVLHAMIDLHRLTESFTHTCTCLTIYTTSTCSCMNCYSFVFAIKYMNSDMTGHLCTNMFFGTFFIQSLIANSIHFIPAQSPPLASSMFGIPQSLSLCRTWGLGDVKHLPCTQESLNHRSCSKLMPSFLLLDFGIPLNPFLLAEQDNMLPLPPVMFKGFGPMMISLTWRIPFA